MQQNEKKETPCKTQWGRKPKPVTTKLAWPKDNLATGTAQTVGN
ncbi:MAG: hypothetical protein Q7R33_08075 [Nitrosarchaeum sp.]|nr:hypothetical protein [Nitrosarchaeum sp.]